MTKTPRGERAAAKAKAAKPYTTQGQDIVIVATLLVIAAMFVIARIYG